MSSPGSPLSNASNDANQNMSSSPAGSSAPSCGSSPESSSTSNQTVSPSKSHWIAIQLVDEKGHPVAGEDYRVTLPDGTFIEDSLDEHGKARISGIDSGTCRVCFPALDQQIWQRG